jgi:hypothetical protein
MKHDSKHYDTCVLAIVVYTDTFFIFLPANFKRACEVL